MQHSPVHSQESCVEDIDFIDFFGAGSADTPGQCSLFDFGSQAIAFFVAELFGIVDFRTVKVGCRYDGCRKDRPGQTTPAGFVTTGFNTSLL